MIDKPLVIGYKGEIGSAILQGLLKTQHKALDICCVDINETEEEVIERIKKSQNIFLCVPIDKTVEWVSKYKEYLTHDKTIFEQCSLKSKILKDPVFNGLHVISMHILYRPSQTPNREDRSIGLVGQEDLYGLHAAGQLKGVLDANHVCFFNTPEDHDKEMAYQQALVHRVILCLDEVLSRGRGTTFMGKKVGELASRVKKGDKDLYGIIQSNDQLGKALTDFQKELDDFKINERVK